jgi:hypothetical protein
MGEDGYNQHLTEEQALAEDGICALLIGQDDKEDQGQVDRHGPAEVGEQDPRVVAWPLKMDLGDSLRPTQLS